MNFAYYRQSLVLILLTFQLALPILSTDIYLPSLTAIGHYFNTSITHVQLTLTTYFFTFGVVQLIYGSLSDRFGRKPMILLSLVIYIIASLGCAFSTSISMLTTQRFIQACGTGSAILTFAIVRDLYQNERVAKAIAYMSAVVALSPILAPILGGYIQKHLSWQWNFTLLALLGMVILVLSCRFLPETNCHRNKLMPLKALFLNYIHLLSDPRYMRHALSAAFAFAALFSYVSGAPYIFLNLMGYPSDVFGWLFATAAIGYVAGAFTNGYLVSKLGLAWMSSIGIASLMSGSVLMTIGIYLYPHHVILILLPQLVCEFGISIVVSNMITKALQPIPQHAGAGSALIGFFRFGLAALCSYLVVVFHSQSPFSLALIILSCSGCSCIFLITKSKCINF